MTRFSIFSPDSPALVLTRELGAIEPKEYERILFSDERMAPRCAIFCDIAAPLYQAMAERHNYRHLVFHSPNLPDKWLGRLEDAALQHPVLRLVPVESERIAINAVLRRHLQEHATRSDGSVFAFRVDDDDFLSEDYLDQVAPLVTKEHHGYGVSFSHGYTGVYESGRYTVLREFEQPLIGIGLGVIGRWSAETAKLSLPKMGNHRRTHFGRTVLLDAQRPTAFWTRHVMQDSAPSNVRKATDPELARNALLKHLRPFKPVTDVEQALHRFPTLRGHLDLRE